MGAFTTERYVEAILRFRWLVLSACVAITAASIGIASQGVITSSFVQMFFGGSPAYDEYRALADQFGESDNIVVAFSDPNILSKQHIQQLEKIAARVAKLEHVEAVYTLANAHFIRAQDNTLEVLPYAEAFDAYPESDVLADIQNNPRVRDWLISARSDAGMLLVELIPDSQRPIEKLPAVVNGALQAFMDAGYTREQLHVAGMAAESVESNTQASYNLKRIFPITAAVLLIIVYVLFVQMWPVIITGLVAILSIIWTLAFSVLLDPQINIMLAMVPGVMTVIGFSDVIHLCSSYLIELRAGYSKREAILRSGADVGRACVYTSVTTLFGFAALVFVPTPVYRQLGVVLSFGVALALFLAMTLVPLCLYWLPTPTLTTPRRMRAGKIVEQFAVACIRFGSERPWPVMLTFGTVTMLSCLAMCDMRVEANLAERLRADNHIRRAQNFIHERFAGTNVIDVYLRLTPEHSGDFLDAQTFAQVADVERTLEKMPDVQRVSSLVDLMRELHQKMAPQQSTTQPLPSTREALSQYLLLFEMSGGDGLSHVIDDEHRTLRLTVHLSHHNLVGTAEAGKQLARVAQQMLPATIQATPTGVTYLLGDWIARIVAGQKNGLWFAMFSTAVAMMFLLRRFWAGLASLIPNAVPIAMLGGYVCVAWDTVDSDTTIIAMLATGIVVDDTIHFLSRLKLELQRSDTLTEALERTAIFTGGAIVNTTIILCMGFLPFAMSDYFTTRIFGTLLPLVLIAALLADLLLGPALVRLGILNLGRARGDEERAAALAAQAKGAPAFDSAGAARSQ